jgi:hypothetical protein
MPVRHLGKLGILVLLGFASPASAYCSGSDKSRPGYSPTYYSLANEFRRASYVAIVRVERETWLGEDGRPKPLRPPFQYGNSRPWGFDQYIGAQFDVRVIQIFKGRPRKTLRLISENSTARFWLDVGREYVILATDQIFDAPIGRGLTLDTCGNSPKLRTKAGPMIEKLKIYSRTMR